MTFRKTAASLEQTVLQLEPLIWIRIVDSFIATGREKVDGYLYTVRDSHLLMKN